MENSKKYSNKNNWLQKGYNMNPKMIATYSGFTPKEKNILTFVFNGLWKDEEGNWEGELFMSNEYIMHYMGCNKQMVLRLKKKCRKLGIFSFKKRYNKSDVWVLGKPPKDMIDEYKQKQKELAAYEKELLKELEF